MKYERKGRIPTIVFLQTRCRQFALVFAIFLLFSFFSTCGITLLHTFSSRSDFPFIEYLPANSSRQPWDFDSMLAAYGSDRAHNRFATTNNVYLHLLNVRNSQPYGGWGTVADYHSQWQTYFWFTQRKWLFKPDLKICEVGMGAGYSLLMFLIATTEGGWKNGATVYEFDIGLDFPDDYGPRKKISYDYTNKMFGDRVRYIWGNTSETIPQFREDNPDFVCDIMHIDGDHSADGCTRDLYNMRFLSDAYTIVFVDDYLRPESNFGITEALERSEEFFHIQHQYLEDSNLDQNFFSVWGIHKGAARIKPKRYIIGRYDPLEHEEFVPE